LTIDGIAAFAAPIVAGGLVLALLMDGARADATRAGGFAVALQLIGAAGWIGALYARDWVELVLGAQIGWLAATALVAMAPERGALNGALRMIAAGGVGAALSFLGAALVGRAIGAGDVASAVNAFVEAPQMATLGLVLIAAPLMLMCGAAPLHAWASAAYGRADAAPVLIVAALGALALLVRIAAVAATIPTVAEAVSAALVGLGVTSVIIGSVQAIGAVNIRRLVAYAGAAQAGCILVAVALESPAGLAAALVQLIALGASAFALLGGAAATRDTLVTALDGLGRRAPFAGAAITAGALCWMGAPLTIGFLGRWRLIEAGVGAGWWWATGAAIVASLAAVFYGGRVIERVYFRRASELTVLDRDAWRWLRMPVLAVTVVIVTCGVSPGWLLDLAARAAALALGLGL
jgi:NADH:ubiquinone oxidoreductase subunit 2 (subunit N)